MNLFAEISVLFSFILGFVNGFNYIQVGPNSLSFDFKTGDNYPVVYHLNVKNIGPERARFDISSDTPWIFTYREGQPSAMSVDTTPGVAFNFVLEIRAEQAKDGVNESQVLINAVSLRDSSVVETKKISIVLNKNVTPSSVSSPSPSPLATETPVYEATPIPTVQPSLTPIISPRAGGRSSTLTPSPTAPTPTPSSEPAVRKSIFKPVWLFFRSIFRF